MLGLEKIVGLFQGALCASEKIQRYSRTASSAPNRDAAPLATLSPTPGVWKKMAPLERSSGAK
jgi:hypothetical protein